MAQHVVIIGAVACGPKSASRFKRLEPDSRVTMIERNDVYSYGGCGIPYFVSGDVADSTQLRTTAFHMVRDQQFFQSCKGVEVVSGTEAVRIDRANKTVHTRRLSDGFEDSYTYDKLVIATGSRPRKLEIPGSDLKNIHYVSDVHDAEHIKEAIAAGNVEKAVIIGAGFIGLEMAEAFADMWDVDTTVVEIGSQILPMIAGPELARMGQFHMEEKGVTFLLNDSVKGFEGENGEVKRVITGNTTLDADVVIVSAGVIPNSELAKEAGLEVSPRGAIVVDETMRTNDPDIFSGGDCVQIKNLVSDSPLFLPLGSLANRQGRVIGTNLAGGDARFPGAVGSWCVKLFERAMSGTGLSLKAALNAGFDADSVYLVQLDRAHFYPDKHLMTLEMVFDKKTRRVLGIQGFGAAGDAIVGRINTVAGLLPDKPTIDVLSNVEMAYSPPFSSAMDILNTLANVAENVLEGLNTSMSASTFSEAWSKQGQNGDFILDCREEADARKYMERHPGVWHNIPQGQLADRFEEIPKDRRIILLCNTGARSYEAQINLRAKGYKDLANLMGGMGGLKQWGLDP